MAGINNSPVSVASHPGTNCFRYKEPPWQLLSLIEKEGYLEAGMRGRLIGVSNERHNMFLLHIDLTEFEDFNRQFESKNYFDKDGVPRLSAREAGYHKEPAESFYVGNREAVDFCDVEEAERLRLYDNYRRAGAGTSYVQWLEDQVLAGVAR